LEEYANKVYRGDRRRFKEKRSKEKEVEGFMKVLINEGGYK